MKYGKAGFRSIYNQFVFVQMNDTILKLMPGIPSDGSETGVVAYGYYDRNDGLMLEILSAGKLEDGKLKAYGASPEESVNMSASTLGDTVFYVFQDKEGKFASRYADQLARLEQYKPSEELELIRGFKLLDPSRVEFFIDDVRVKLVKFGLRPEEARVRVTGTDRKSFYGILLDEPAQDFGWHKGDDIVFAIMQMADGGYVCVTDMIPVQTIKAADLEDGTMLKKAITDYRQDRTEYNLINAFSILRDSCVWVPFVDDGAGIDILRRGSSRFFPCFSCEAEMDGCSSECQKAERSFLEVMKLAGTVEGGIDGIVVNPYTEPLLVSTRYFEIIARMESRIEEE